MDERKKIESYFMTYEPTEKWPIVSRVHHYSSEAILTHFLKNGTGNQANK